MLTWLLETCVHEDTSKVMMEAIRQQGFKIEIVKYAAFGDYEINLDPQKPVIYHGSVEGCDFIQNETDLSPGVLIDPLQYECTGYYAALGDLVFNCDYVMLPFGDVLRRKEWLDAAFADDGCVFIRPNSWKKSFTGQVLDLRTWEGDSKNLGYTLIEPNDLVVVSKPYKIDAEWRLIVADGKVVTGSQYKENGNSRRSPQVPAEVFEFADRILGTGYNPNKAWVLDVCKSGEDISVLEIGPVNCCGLYLCNIFSFVRAISKCALEAWEEIKAGINPAFRSFDQA